MIGYGSMHPTDLRILTSYKKDGRKLNVRSQNERVELAMQILDRRRKLRQAAWDDATVEQIRTEIKRLERRLREIDE
jgi:hypothetical protein